MKDILKTIAGRVGVLPYIQQKRVNDRLKANFKRDYNDFLALQSAAKQRFQLSEQDLFEKLYDNSSNTWFDRHYIYHPAWAARIVKQTAPEYHIDISSTLNFCAIASAFVPVKFYDYRPANLVLDGLTSERADLNALDFETNSIQSLSCMHTVEHIGLGRYGDVLDYDGDLKAMKELSRVVAVGGSLLFVVPVGHEAKIMFNAHRIYTRDMIINSFPDLTLKEFTLIPENSNDGGLVANPSDELLSKQNYGCGCFWFVKQKRG